MPDIIEKISNSTIQHGKFNNRIYVMEYDEKDHIEFINSIEKISETNHYSKIFTKIPSSALPSFLVSGFQIEAYIPYFFNGNSHGFFVSKFYSDRRKVLNLNDYIVFEGVINKYNNKITVSNIINNNIEKNRTIKLLDTSHSKNISKLLSTVFPVYPFPVHEPAYIKKTMGENIKYFGYFENNKLLAVSSCEMYLSKDNAEMTDFAVLPELRGKGIANSLLSFMEDYCKNNTNIKTLYTIARLNEPGINALFLKNNYCYCGTLINNTKIYKSIESMNVYYKFIK